MNFFLIFSSLSCCKICVIDRPWIKYQNIIGNALGRLSRLCLNLNKRPKNSTSTKLYVHEFGFWCGWGEGGLRIMNLHRGKLDRLLIICCAYIWICCLLSIMTTMSGLMVHQYSVFVNAENNASRNSTTGLRTDQGRDHTQCTGGSHFFTARDSVTWFFSVVIFRKFIEF